MRARQRRSTGLPLKTCHFLYFCSLSPDTHEMQWSLHVWQAAVLWLLEFRSEPKPNFKCKGDSGTSEALPKVCGDTASYVGNIWLWFFSTYAVSVEPFQCNVLFLCVFVVSFFPLFPSLPHPSLGAASCPVQAERRARKLPIWPCP